MKLDPILAEIRAVREAYAEQFAGDVKAMIADLNKRQEKSVRKVVSRPPKLRTPANTITPKPA